MRIIIGASVLLASLSLACGSDGEETIATPRGDEILHLRGFVITADNFRDAVRSLYIDTDPAFCASIDGFTPTEALDALDAALGLGEASGVPIPGATPISPEESRNRDDELRAARMTLDECGAPGAGPTRTPGAGIPSPGYE